VQLRATIIISALAFSACVGDSNPITDAGGTDASTDASNDVQSTVDTGTDAAPTWLKYDWDWTVSPQTTDVATCVNKADAAFTSLASSGFVKTNATNQSARDGSRHGAWAAAVCMGNYKIAIAVDTEQGATPIATQLQALFDSGQGATIPAETTAHAVPQSDWNFKPRTGTPMSTCINQSKQAIANILSKVTNAPPKMDEFTKAYTHTSEYEIFFDGVIGGVLCTDDGEFFIFASSVNAAINTTGMPLAIQQEIGSQYYGGPNN
jgi:hypothetical protein